ncbi:hypothetical protein D8674_024228 [Pyrus ussuriensis x Pyrus communis]|uniref:Transmembrane protein n=1 Tax=Pyrus ussuriensis x Pyrus communis TaxID=2448454 RepID=A0A5N5H2C4_9ROSA|nr:hypothetical protein D8674_024228 [Pyrus ussuriensis x Pyrus communis]
MGKSRVAAHRKTDEKLKSKRRDASKEVAKDPNKLKRPAIALFVVIFCCCSAAFDYVMTSSSPNISSSDCIIFMVCLGCSVFNWILSVGSVFEAGKIFMLFLQFD